MTKTVSDIEKLILDRNFSYDPPYFYNNDLALRCELGIGESEEKYLANAKSRAAEIFGILFEGGVDLFFFDDYIVDYDFDMGNTISIAPVIEQEKRRLKFCLGYQKKFRHKIVRDIAYDQDDSDVIRRNRICCYPNKKFDALSVINSMIDRQDNPTVHLVSFTNNCIFTVYDDRGCDVVFYDKGKFKTFYPLLEQYFLAYDFDLMKTRLNENHS